jgi:ABC-2 type transport system ATP-binding protein
MIEIKNVSKTYNGHIKAIDNVTLDIPNGKIIGFIGLNGAGKTTLIKMMTGILKPDKGTIKINGLDIEKDSLEAKQNIGYLTDSPDMFLRLTGIEFINFISDE